MNSVGVIIHEEPYYPDHIINYYSVYEIHMDGAYAFIGIMESLGGLDKEKYYPAMSKDNFVEIKAGVIEYKKSTRLNNKFNFVDFVVTILY